MSKTMCRALTPVSFTNIFFTKSRRANCQEHRFPEKPTRLGTTPNKKIKTCPTALNVVCLPPVPDIIGIRLLTSNLDLVDG